MSIPRRRRTSIRTVIANLQGAIDELDERVTMLEQEDEWLETEEWSAPTITEQTGIGSATNTVTIPAETLVNLIKAAPINTSMSEGNVGIGSTATDGNIGVGTSNVGIGSTATDGNVGVGSSEPSGNVGIGSTATDGNVGVGT